MGNLKPYPKNIQNMRIVDLEKQKLILKMVLKTGINAYLKDKVKVKMLLFFNHRQYVKNRLNVNLRHNKKFLKNNILLLNIKITTICG